MHKAQSRETYHHGNLPATLIAEGAKLLAERGIDGFSMREVARRAGVAVAAPAHHFRNSKGLLTAIATEGFAMLVLQLERIAASEADAEEQVIAMCQAYVKLGVSDPGHAVIMFRLDLLDKGHLPLSDTAFRAFDLVAAAVRRATSHLATETQIDYATRTLWAATQGLVALETIDDQDPEELISFAVRTLFAGMHRNVL